MQTKLKPDVSGSCSAGSSPRRSLQQPNRVMTTPQFIKRVWTMLQVNDTALIVPMLSDDGATITGYYPILQDNVPHTTLTARYGSCSRSQQA